MKNSIIHKLFLFCALLCLLPLLLFLLLASAGFALFYLLLIVLPFIIFSLLAMYYIRTRVIVVLNMLTKEANQISSGDLSHVIEYRKDDEIGAFIRAFEDMRIQLYKRQQQQQQFEIERKNFIDNISHDLKTPIASSSAYIEALQDHIAASPQEEQQYLKIVQDKLELLAQLSGQLSLSYSSPDEWPLLPQEADCSVWASEFLENVSSECRIRNIKPDLINLIPSGYKTKAYICIDHGQFERALQNIFSNAFRYMKKYFSVSVQIEAEHLLIRIANDGAILDQGDEEKIFDRFYTQEIHNAQGHLGLGLYITKTIIQAMNGTVRADREADRIRFEICLPLLFHGC